MKVTPQIISNRQRFLDVLRSGKYKKGCIKSDEKGYPVIESKEDDEGYCACAIMIHEFPDREGKESMVIARQALGLLPEHCRYIQQELNDSALTFPEIADRIEVEFF